jgi:hypothetical protein
LRDIDQEELNGVFQAWMQQVQEVNQIKAIEITLDDK